MPVEPVPCSPGGGGEPVEVTTCCSPSIASAPLCRPDGSTVLLVVRSGCADCGGTAADPSVAGWIDPATGTFTAGPAPADAGPCEPGPACCSPSIASAPMCRADGSTVLLIVRSGCIECGQGADDPAVVGWLDTTGIFTPGALPADAGPCEAGCIDTVCRQLCDDADGDGEADTTYSELWCIRADGTAELVLTYRDDPSVPYTPLAPVDCTYGCPEPETLQLCDDSGPFLRRYTWLNGVATFEDFELDGVTAHLVNGDVTTCAGTGGSTAPPCAEQTTPAATLGLCLPDGTPLAVVITRDCATGTVTQDGWLNLTTGAYTSGPPPAGAMACGDSRAFELAGLLCDVSPATGDVLGLVLVEYEYNADGSLASVRLVDPATGTTYTLQGELRHCPANADQEQPDQDLTILCDVQPDGTATPFVRDYRRDPASGQITGHTDYTLDGTPYTPTGTTGQCAEPCQNTTSLLLCDLPVDGTPEAAVTDTDPSPFYPYPTGAPVAGAQVLWDGGTLNLPPGTGPQPGTTGTVNSLAATIQAPRPACDTGTAHVTVSLNAQQTGPDDGCGPTGHLRLFTGTTQVALTVLPANTPAGYSGTLTVEADVSAADLAAGNIVVALALDAYDDSGGICPGTRSTGWQLSGFTPAVTYDQVGCDTQFLRSVLTDCETGVVTAVVDTTLNGVPYEVQGETGQCSGTGAGGAQGGPDSEVVQLCDTAEDDTVTPFLRHLTYPAGGGTPTITDTLLDGTTPYTPIGEVGLCGDRAEPCRDSASTLLCDVAALDTLTVLDTVNQASADGWELTSFTDGGCTGYNPPDGPVPGPAIWSAPGYLGARADRTLGAGTCAGTWTGYDTAPIRWLLTKTFTAPQDGMALVTADNFRADGGARVRVNGQDVGLYGQWNQPAVGGSTQVPVTSGPNVVEIEVRDIGGPNWLRGQLDIVMTRTVQFFRKTVTDCTTGDVVSVTDTTLDGQPYTVTGEVGQCEPVAECCEPPPPETRLDIESDVLCIRDQDGEITGQVVVERVYDDQTGERTEQRLTDPTTGDEVTLPAGAELVVCNDPPCPVNFATECVGSVTRTEAAYDNTSLIGGVPGQCGSVQGPGGMFPCQPASGVYTITSWIVNGEEVIGEGSGRDFNGGPCGTGTVDNPGMHLNWSQALTNLDPTGATWTAQNAPGCAWFVGSTGGTQTVYGAMTVVDAAGQQWILGPAQSCEETQFTKVYTQECDGTVSVSWLDAQGVATEAPDGDLVPCGTGCGAGGGQGLDVEPLTLCDVLADGTPVPFLRHLTYGSAGQVAAVVDTALDGFAPYTPTGTVGLCQPEPTPDIEVVQLCDLVDGQDPVPFLRHLTYLPGTTTPIVVDTALDGSTPYAVTGTVGVCPETCTVRAVIEACRCDDTTGDGTADTEYVELLAVDCTGSLTSIGTYTCDLSTPYTPVAPVSCEGDAEGAEPALGVQAHRVQLAPGGSWSADTVAALQSVTATAHTGTGEITTSDGTSTLFQGESVTWSVSKEGDALLAGPLTITAVGGIVTVTYTRGITLS
ncbi:hypothetical protein ACH437_23655 [Streptomyces xinghaiensis]|uniref:hypothetical protein n=1 Tax=Streptomyces xinghaiensis TaxID=1038928 RepID=UPI00379B4779